jgi:hypothetical protein
MAVPFKLVQSNTFILYGRETYFLCLGEKEGWERASTNCVERCDPCEEPSASTFCETQRSEDHRLSVQTMANRKSCVSTGNRITVLRPSAGHFVHFIQLVVCLTTGLKPLPKWALHIVWSRTSSFKWEYPLLSLRSSNSFLRLLLCLPLTSILPFIFPSIITRCRRQFLRKMWSIQFAFRLRISCRLFLFSLTQNNTSSFLTWSVQMIFSTLLQHLILKFCRCFWSTARRVQVLALYKAMLQT